MKKSYLMAAVAVSASAVAIAEDINREGDNEESGT